MWAKNVLITGGTGTAGHAFTRRLLQEPGLERLVILSRDELKQARMCAEFTDPRLRFFIGDVRNRSRLKQAFRGVDAVIHAAAMKRIETCEAEPLEAVATNITGTINVAHACLDAGVERAIFLSTDKAPCAHTLYGMTKATAERLWLRSNVYAAGTNTRFAATRYGNVLGSRGSVLDTWTQQMANGEPLTITDAGSTRFWMRIEQAVDLVLLALPAMRGGEVFIPKIKAAPLLDLARALAERSGTTYAPGHVETGLRPGERRHETLISEDELPYAYDAVTHYLLEPMLRTWEALPAVGLPRLTVPYRSDTAPRHTIEELRAML